MRRETGAALDCLRHRGAPLALARQHPLTSAFDFYRLKEPERGPSGGFEYLRRQNAGGEEIGGIATWVPATMDLAMGDLLRNMRSSRIFSVCGLPDARVEKAGRTNTASRPSASKSSTRWRRTPTIARDPTSRHSFSNTDYDGLRFHVRQVFFPRTSAWSGLKRSLRGAFDEGVRERLAGAVGAPFRAGAHARTAVKAIDDRGNEPMAVEQLSEAEG